MRGGGRSVGKITQLGEVIPCWNGDGVFTGLEPHTPQENSSKNAERRTIKGYKLNKNNRIESFALAGGDYV